MITLLIYTPAHNSIVKVKELALPYPTLPLPLLPRNQATQQYHP